jgi:hypothetical protein
MPWVRNVRGAGPPDEGADPGNGREDHVYNRAEHENQKGAVPITELAEEDAEDTVAQAEEEPANQTGSQEISRSAEKAKNGDRSEEAENCSGGDVPFLRETLQKRDMIGDHKPS